VENKEEELYKTGPYKINKKKKEKKKKSPVCFFNTRKADILANNPKYLARVKINSKQKQDWK